MSENSQSQSANSNQANSMGVNSSGAILFSAFVVSTLIGQSLMDLFFGLFFIWFGIKAFSSKNGKLKLPVLFPGKDRFWILWVGVVALSFLINYTAEVPWTRIFSDMIWILNLFIMRKGIELFPPTEKKIKWFAIAFLIPSFYSFGTLIAGYDPLLGKEISRAGGLFSNAMTYAHSLSIPFLILCGVIACHLFAKKKIHNIFWPILGTSFLGLSLLLTLTRGVWIGIFVAIIAAAFLYKPKIGWITTLASVLLVAALFVGVKPIRDRIMFTQNYENSYDRQRVWLWKTNWLIFTENPILGIGYGENKRRLAEYYSRLDVPQDKAIFAHAHNQYLHFAAGTGILGLGCYVYFLGMLLMISVKNYRFWQNRDAFKSGLSLGSFAAIICFAIGGLTEANFEHSKIKYMMVVLSALILWLKAQGSAPESNQQVHPTDSIINQTH